MADDFQDKTEEATPKKLADAKRKGEVARSQDLGSSILLFVLIFSFLFFGGYMFEQFVVFCRAMFMNLSYPFDDAEAIYFWAKRGVKHLFFMMAPFGLAAMLAGAMGNVVQIGWLFTTHPLTPKWKKVNVFDPSNYKKFFNAAAFMRLFFGLAKIAVVGVICTIVIMSQINDLSQLMHGSSWDIFIFIIRQTLYMGLVISILLLFLGVADFAFQKWKFAKDMRMTKSEVKDERRQTEGDMQMKSKVRSMMVSFAQSRMKEAVPKADVVIANPVHYAIAVKYDANKAAAPICLAKGARKMAEAIKAIARENQVPIVENPPLAQALYKVVEVGSMIPPDFYHAVAEVLAHVYRLNEQMGRKAAAAANPRGQRASSRT